MKPVKLLALSPVPVDHPPAKVMVRLADHHDAPGLLEDRVGIVNLSLRRQFLVDGSGILQTAISMLTEAIPATKKRIFIIHRSVTVLIISTFWRAFGRFSTVLLKAFIFA